MAGLARSDFPGTEGFGVDTEFLGAFFTGQFEFQSADFEVLAEW
jgi:hypothetical protein